MQSNEENSKLPVNPPFFYGWIIVFISAVSIFLSGPGQTYSISIFIDSFIQDFGWNRSLVSLLYSLGTLLAGFTVPQIGKQFDRYGHRKIMALVAIAFGLSLMWMSFIVSPLMLFLGFYMIRLLGQSSMVIGPSTLVPQWFEKKRGKALSLMSIGGRVGAAALPPLNIWIISNWGWRNGWRFWGITIWIVMIPLIIFFIRNRPENVNLTLDGLSPSEKEQIEEEEKDNKNANPAAASITLAEAKRKPVFWFLLYCMFVPAMIGTGVTFHIVSIFGERGLSPQIAAYTLSAIAVVGFPATLLSGFILDRIRVRYLLITTFVLYSFLIIWLINIQNVYMALIYGALMGLIMGLHRVNVNMIWPTYFGLKHLGSIRGMVQFASVTGAAFGPFPIGLAYDYFGGYNIILGIMFVFPLLAIAASYLAVAPGEKEKE